MVLKIILGSVVVVCVGIAVNYYVNSNNESGGQCKLKYKYPVKHMATKSPYIHPEDKLCNIAGNCDSRESFEVPPGCSAEQIWIIVRHGSRNPSAKVITRMRNHLIPLRKEILQNYHQGKGDLCEEDIEAWKNWNFAPGLVEAAEKYLVPQGESELLGIGRRYKQKLPHLFQNQFGNETHKFKYTKTQRAEASAKSFVEGLFGKDGALNVWYPTALSADPVLRFYKGCPKWKRDVDKNPEAYKERIIFEKSEIFRTTLKNTMRRNGFERELSLSEIETIYLACAFETSWNPNTISPWCAFFDEEAFKMLEYRQDLEYYWIDGYGVELTYKQACPAVIDLMNHFSEKISDPFNSPAVIAYFTHSGTTLKLLARLGLFKDTEELRSDNFQKHLHTRMWRTSVIDKFGTNLAFVLYKCPDTYKVGTLFQEHPIKLPACRGKWTCSYEELRSGFDHIINDCDMSKMCKI